MFAANAGEKWTQRREDVSKIWHWKSQCTVSTEGESYIPMDCNWSFSCHGSTVFISSSYTHSFGSNSAPPVTSAFSFLWKPKSKSSSQSPNVRIPSQYLSPRTEPKYHAPRTPHRWPARKVHVDHGRCDASPAVRQSTANPKILGPWIAADTVCIESAAVFELCVQ